MKYDNCLLMVKVCHLPPEWNLIVEAWCRGCGYLEYKMWCAKDNDKPLERELFDVVYDALQEEFLYETEQLPEEQGILQEL